MQTEEQNNIENFSQPPIKKDILPQALPMPTPDNPPWNWLVAAAVWLASVLLLLIIPSIVVIPYAVSKGVNLQDAEALKNFLFGDSSAVLLQIILVIPIHALTLALSWAVVTKFNKFSFRETLGWKWGGFKFWHIVLIIISFFVLAAILTSLLGEKDNDLLRILRSSRTAVYIIAFLATFTAPVVEEVVYRGILYSTFQKAFGVFLSVFVVTMLFAGVHFFEYWGDPSALIMITLLSLTLTLIRAKTGNLLPCIVLHTIFNGVQSLILIFEPLLREQTNQTTQQAVSFLHFIR